APRATQGRRHLPVSIWAGGDRTSALGSTDCRSARASMPIVIGSTVTPSLSKWPSQIKPRRPATARAARAADRPADRDSFFWGYERLRRTTGSLTISPALSHIASIGFILAATVFRWAVPGSAPVICLSFCLVTNGRPQLMSTIELVDPELRDALAQQL